MRDRHAYYLQHKEHILAKAKKWYEENKELCMERHCKRRRDYYQKNKKLCHKKQFAHDRKIPWTRTYRSILGRCGKNGVYTKKGIKALIKPRELKELWIRDKAHLLKKPSIDRIDPSGHYTKENCRYVEMSENLKRRDMSRSGFASIAERKTK